MKTIRMTAVSLALGASLAFAQEAQEAPPPPPPNDYPEYQQQQQQPYQQYPQEQQPAYAGPRKIKNWSPDQPVPPGYTAVSKPRMGLLVGGIVTFGISYGVTALVGAVALDTSRGSSQTWPLLIPVIGPFIQMAVTPVPGLNVLLAVDGLVQATGVGLFIAGLAARTVTLVRTANLTLTPVPVVTAGGGNGLGIAGTF